MNINLKRIVSRNEILSIINKVIELAGQGIAICNDKGEWIYGSKELPPLTGNPIKADDVVIGWVTGGAAAVIVAELLSVQAGAEYEKRMLIQETLDKYREIAMLYYVTEKLAANLDPTEVAHFIVEEAHGRIECGEVILALFGEAEEGIQIVSSTDLWPFLPDFCASLSRQLADSSYSNAGEIVNALGSDSRFVCFSDKMSSFMGAPLKINDKIIGLLLAVSLTPADYTAGEFKRISALALQAAASIENARLYDQLKDTFRATVQSLAESLEKRDPYTGGHTRRVMEYSLAIGRALHLSAADLSCLEMTAMLHDIGKIGVKDDILRKPGKLTDEEFQEIRRHVTYGEEILEKIKSLTEIIPGVKYHHERFDGRGYPDGLKGLHIHQFARIIAVADTFDAMTTDRPYRKAMPWPEAFAELERHAGTQFDPDIVDVFLKIHDELIVEPTGTE